MEALASLAALVAFLYPREYRGPAGTPEAPRVDAHYNRAQVLDLFGIVNKRRSYINGSYLGAWNNLPRNAHLEIRHFQGWKFVMFPVSYPGLKRFHVECPVCQGIFSVGHFMMHASTHSPKES